MARGARRAAAARPRSPRAARGRGRRGAGPSCVAMPRQSASLSGSPGPLRRATGSPPRAAPPGPRPPKRRSGRSGGRSHRGPAGRARAAGPRSGPLPGRASPGHVPVAGVLHDGPDLDPAVLGDGAGDLHGPIEALDVDGEDPSEELLDLAVRSVRHRGYAILELDERLVPAEALDADEL